MQKCQLEIGTKLVVKSKTIGGCLSSSFHWGKAVELNQPYLYLSKIERGNELVLAYKKGWASGDYFSFSDVELYVPDLQRYLKGEKFAVHCPTQEEAQKFMEFMHKKGKRWGSGTSLLQDSNYITYKEQTVYYNDFSGLSYGTNRYAKSSGYKIIEFKDIEEEVAMEKYTNFKKSDLRSGMWVETRDGQKYLVVGDTISQSTGHMKLSSYDEDLLLAQKFISSDNKFDIVKVYESGVIRLTYNASLPKLIWERKDNSKEIANVQKEIEAAQKSLKEAQEKLKNLENN